MQVIQHYTVCPSGPCFPLYRHSITHMSSLHFFIQGFSTGQCITFFSESILGQEGSLNCISWMRAPRVPGSSPRWPGDYKRTCRVQVKSSRCQLDCFRGQNTAGSLSLEWHWVRLRVSTTVTGEKAHWWSGTVKTGGSEWKGWWKGDPRLWINHTYLPGSDFFVFGFFSSQFYWLWWTFRFSSNADLLIAQFLPSSGQSFFQFHL